ncbi:MAG TPA: hypothetical protein VLL52_15235 [Anaerolineae bacterium]|nr:hypothetical protein [Anaerolineae bacterium]
MVPSIPPRIHILLASQSDRALVIRRGPSKQVATILWQRDTDTFRLGQWLKGRLYARRADISPDGQYFIYFAMNGRWHTRSPGSWTAISRVPYLKALAFFPQNHSWYGGGLFLDNQHYWLHAGYNPRPPKDDTQLTCVANYPTQANSGGPYPGVYYPRLIRDGWRLIKHDDSRYQHTIDTFDKPLFAGWHLRKLVHSQVSPPPGKSIYWDEHKLIQPQHNITLHFPDWGWAEKDGHKDGSRPRRLVYVTHGQLFATNLNEQGLINTKELYDFNAMTFEPIIAPY